MAGERKVGGEVTWQAFPLGHMDEDKSSAQGMMGQWVEHSLCQREGQGLDPRTHVAS